MQADTRQWPPVRRQKKRRKPPVWPWVAALVLVLVVLICIALQPKDETPEPTQSTSSTEAPTAAPTTQPTEAPEPPPTEPPEPTPEEEIAEFAALHGYTLADYPEKLIELYKRNPEAREFVLNYPLEYGKPHEVDVSDQVDDEGVPLFIQWDPRWGYQDYVTSVAGLSACGPTCMAMAAFHFTRDPAMNPSYMMEFAMSNRSYANEVSGTQWTFFKEGPKELGLDSRELTSEEIASESKLASLLEKGNVIVVNVGPGVFTVVGHFILLVGYEDGKFQVNDPNSYEKSAQLWSYEEFSDQVKMMWAISE